jgi:DNA-binding MarR family transcriptional regulator
MKIIKKSAKPRRPRIDLDQRTAYQFSILAARQTRCLAEMYLERFGMTVSRWKVLVIIGRFAPVSAKDVAQRTSLEPEKVTRAVDGLVRQRYVIRRKDPKDKRRVILSLSQTGQEVFAESERIRYAIESEFLNVLGPNELRMFYGILNKLEQRAIQIFAGKRSWHRILAQHEGAKAASGVKTRSAGAIAASE